VRLSGKRVWILLAAGVIALSVSATVKSASGTPSYSGSFGVSPAGSVGASGCRLYGSAAHDEGYWSACFPTLHMDISWDGFTIDPGGEDVGSEIGLQATHIDVFRDAYFVETEQSSNLHDRALIAGTLSDPDCGADATPSFDGHGDGLLENQTGDDSFDGWAATDGGGRPTNGFWEPNVADFTVSYPTCQGASIPSEYTPGAPAEGSRCPADPRKQPVFALYFGKYTPSGTLAKGMHDTWTFNCKFQPNDVWTSSGTFTMTENPCPRITKGHGFTKLSRTTRTAAAQLYRELNHEGGCYRFVRGWIDHGTHAQNLDISIGFRPEGLAAFARTRELRAYIVPVLQRIATSAGLCGPSRVAPTHLQAPYRKGKEKKRSCHLTSVS
jgi:hypothetical protein